MTQRWGPAWEKTSGPGAAWPAGAEPRCPLGSAFPSSKMLRPKSPRDLFFYFFFFGEGEEAGALVMETRCL